MKISRFSVPALTGLLLAALCCGSLPLQGQTKKAQKQADELLTQAANLYLKRDFVQATNKARRALQITPKNPRAYVGLGYSLAARGDRTRAADALYSALENGATGKNRTNAFAKLRELALPSTRPVAPTSKVVTASRGPKPTDSKPTALKLAALKLAASKLPSSRSLRVFVGDSSSLLIASFYLMEDNELFLPLGQTLSALGWSRADDPATGTLGWTRGDVTIRHRLGTSTMVRITGAGEEAFDFGIATRERTLNGVTTGLAPTQFFIQVLGGTTQFDRQRLTLRLFPDPATGSARATPLLAPNCTLAGTLIGIAAPFDTLQIKIETPGETLDLPIAPGARVQRLLLPDKVTAQMALQSNSSPPAAARRILATDLVPGEALRLTVTSQGGREQISQLLAVALAVPERVVSATPTQIELASYPGEPFQVGPQLRFYDEIGGAGDAGSLSPGRVVAVIVNPLTQKLYGVSARREDVTLAGEPSPSEAPVSPSNAAPVNSAQSWRDAQAAPGSSVTALSLSPDRNLLAAAGSDGSVRLWGSNGELVRRLNAGRSSILSLAWTDDHTLLAGRADGSIAVWQGEAAQFPAGPTVVWGAPNAGPVRALGVSPDGRIVAAGHRTESASGAVTLWSAQSGQQLPYAPALISGCDALFWLPPTALKHPLFLASDGRFPITSNEIDAQYARVIVGPSYYDTSLRPVRALTASRDAVFAGDESGTIHHWPLHGNDLARRSSVRFNDPASSASILALALSPDGRLLASASTDGTVRLWNVQSGALTHLPNSTRALGRAPAGALMWLSENRLAAGVGSDVTVWTVR